MRTIIRLSAAALLVVVCVVGWTRPPAPAHSSPAPQNVVMILTDDQRWDSLQYMPNVESELVAQGVSLSNVFDNNPLCCPTRSTILTGLTSGHNGVWGNVPGNTGGFQGFLKNHDQDRQVFGWLHDAGYHTGFIGKFLNGYRPADVPWILPGVDEWMVMLLDHLKTQQTGCMGGGYFGTCYSHNGVREADSASTYSTTTTGNDAVDFIQSAPSGQPLFLLYAPRAPHQPTTPEKKYDRSCKGIPPIRPPSYNQQIANSPAYMNIKSLSNHQRQNFDALWVASCQTLLSVDDQVGRIVSSLQQTGRLANTLIVFASDNGYLWGEHRWHGKIVPYDESIRVPVVIRDDAVIPAGLRGTTSDEQSTSLDYTSTFLQAAGLSRPLDGESWFPLIGGEGTWTSQDTVLLEDGGSVGNEDGKIKPPAYCGVRTTGFMYSQYSTGEEELYDLSVDPFETTNVAGDSQYANVLNALRSQDHQLCDPVPPNFTWAH